MGQSLIALDVKPVPNQPRFDDLTGRRFGRLVVVAYAGASSAGAKWWCQCDCGLVTSPSALNLRCGKTKSCGCLKAENAGNRVRTHGKRAHPLYDTWAKMRSRCEAPTDPAYPRYGGRGIAVCDRWSKGEGGRSGFECFLSDMGEKPSPELSIDRIDNDQGYVPGNCRWATAKQQADNRRPPS